MINLDGEEAPKRFHWEVILRLGLKGWSRCLPDIEFVQGRVFQEEPHACAKTIAWISVMCWGGSEQIQSTGASWARWAAAEVGSSWRTLRCARGGWTSGSGEPWKGLKQSIGMQDFYFSKIFFTQPSGMVVGGRYCNILTEIIRTWVKAVIAGLEERRQMRKILRRKKWHSSRWADMVSVGGGEVMVNGWLFHWLRWKSKGE